MVINLIVLYSVSGTVLKNISDGGYLAKAQSKEQIMDAYDNASSHPSEYHEQMSRTREILSRSRDALNRIEESTVEVCKL